MNFDFSDDQKTVREEAARFLKKECDLEAVRRVLEGDEPYDRKLWKAVAEMGWTATALPEEFGGFGFGYLELCVIAEQLGKALAPIPFASTVYLASEALLAAGTDAQKKAWLPKIAKGEAVGTFAVAEGPRALGPRNIETRASGGKITGVKTPIMDGDTADFAVVLARTAEGDADSNASLFIVDLKGAGVTREAVPSVDPSRSHGKIEFKDAAAEPLGAAGAGWSLTERIFNRAAILLAMEQVGGAEAALSMAQVYARERYAFGRPIGSFQAIKHKLADMYAKVELARSNSYYGAWAIANDSDDLPVAAAAARLSASEAFHYASKENIQTHGGNGFTWEYNCHMYYRRARLLSQTLGSPRVWKEKLITGLEARRAA